MRRGALGLLCVLIATSAVVELGGCSGPRVETHGAGGAGSSAGGRVSLAGGAGSAAAGAGGRAGSSAGGAAGASGGAGGHAGTEPENAGASGEASGGESGAPPCDGNDQDCTGALPRLVAGSNHTCLIARDGRVRCWGADTTAIYDSDGYSTRVHGVSSPPVSRFRSLVAGDASTCGITEGGALECWGGVGSLPYPIGSGDGIRAVGLSAYLRAVLRVDGTLLTPDGVGLVALEGEFSGVSTSSRAACALRTDGRAHCFGAGVTTFGLSAEPPGPFRHVTVGTNHACALHEDRTVACWGDDGFGQATAPPGEFLAVDAGALHTCGLRADHTLVCWGQNDEGESSPPAGKFESLAVGEAHGCALRADDTVVCWGRDAAFQASPPPGLTGQGDGFETLALAGDSIHRQTVWVDWIYDRRGAAHACGLRPDGTLACFGADAFGQATPPTGAFTKVSTGTGSSCALRVSGELECWGGPLAQSAERPAGEFVDVSVGYAYGCAIRADGALACWEGIDTGRPNDPNVLLVGVPPLGAFVQVSVSGATESELIDSPYEERLWAAACALDTAEDVHCWWSGGDRVESGPFTEVRVGYDGVAALRDDGSVLAWAAGGTAWTHAGPFVQIGAGDGFVCGRSQAGGILCFDRVARLPAIPGTFVDLSVSGDTVCGLRENGNVACFYGIKRDG
jgi:alpha-tubulin suppressor-like RCC1 family protein